MTPKEAAIDLIKVYVLRGETIKDLQNSSMGAHGGNYNASVGGYIFPDYWYIEPKKVPTSVIKKIPSNKILVQMVDNKIVNEIFSLETIFNEIRSGNIQKELL